MTASIPQSHLCLLCPPAHAVLTTMLPDGTPQSSLVWVDYVGQHILINTTLERLKGRNMQRNPKVTVFAIDAGDGSRWLEVRGRVVEITTEGAVAHADLQTSRYGLGRRFYGDIYPVERQQKETRVIVKIEPMHVAVDAIFR